MEQFQSQHQSAAASANAPHHMATTMSGIAGGKSCATNEPLRVDPRDLGHVGAVSKSFPFRFRKLGMCVCHSVGFLAGTRAGHGCGKFSS